MGGCFRCSNEEDHPIHENKTRPGYHKYRDKSELPPHMNPMTTKEVRDLMTATLHGPLPHPTVMRMMATLAAWMPQQSLPAIKVGDEFTLGDSRYHITNISQEPVSGLCSVRVETHPDKPEFTIPINIMRAVCRSVMELE
jgi:hypothetical protein